MIEFQVEGMTCQHCVAAVTKAIKAVDGSADVQIDLANGSVKVNSASSTEALGTAIADAGYDVKQASRSA